MNYKETINYLFTRLPMFQRKGPAAYKDGLENTLKLDELYSYPHKNFKTVHVAGTNGKGSVSHMLSSVLQEAGYKTGLYTSPHLKDFRERIRINGEMISEEAVVNWVAGFIKNNSEPQIEPSFFELTVAMAFDYFSSEKVDIAIIEVGLGGRLDSTNIISPELSIITNIGMDHTALLGDTLSKIATEKAGIIKPSIPVVIGTTQKETQDVFQKTAEKLQSKICFADKEYIVDYSLTDMHGKQNLSIKRNDTKVYPDLKLDLRGTYQLKNIPAVLKAIDVLRDKDWTIPTQSVYEGLAKVANNTSLLGRWQIIGNNPQIICDTGHNEDGIRNIVEQIKNSAYKKLHFIFGTVADKDPGPVLQLLPKDAEYYFVKANIERAMDEQLLLKKALRLNLKGEAFSSVQKALKYAQLKADQDDLIFVGGSTFVVAEIL